MSNQGRVTVFPYSFDILVMNDDAYHTCSCGKELKDKDGAFTSSGSFIEGVYCSVDCLNLAYEAYYKTKNRVYVVIVEDRHTDVDVTVFKDKDEAIKYAKEQARANSRSGNRLDRRCWMGLQCFLF